MEPLARSGSILTGLAATAGGFGAVGLGLLGVVAGQVIYASLIAAGAALVPVGWYGLVTGIDPNDANAVTTDPVEPESRNN